MKVKLFQSVVTVSFNNDGSDFSTIESKINAFLEENPELEVIDVKLASHAARVEHGPTNYGLVALLMYEDRK